MPFFRSLLPGLLLLASGPTICLAQTVSSPRSALGSTLVPETAIQSEVRPDILLKVGLNAARSFRWSGYYGIPFRVPVSVGAEYRLNPKFTLYGELNADFAVPRSTTYFGERTPLIPTGALSLGGRYYYNQVGRTQHNRAHGAFQGNYLAAEIHAEVWNHFNGEGLNYPAGSATPRRDFVPTLNLLWGAQRRLSRSFLFDANAGIGIGANRSTPKFGGLSAGPVNLSGQVNLGIYFGR